MCKIFCYICGAEITKYNENNDGCMEICKYCKEDVDKEVIYDEYLNNN